MSTPQKRSPPENESSAASTSDSPETPKRVKKAKRMLTLPQPGSPPGSPRERVDSIFADICPRMSSNEILETMFEEMLKLVKRKELPATMLEDPNVLFSWDLLVTICEKVLNDRDAFLRAEYMKVLNAKLAEQQEFLTKLVKEELEEQLTNTGEPSYMT